jgi:hypothetical protein
VQAASRGYIVSWEIAVRRVRHISITVNNLPFTDQGSPKPTPAGASLYERVYIEDRGSVRGRVGLGEGLLGGGSLGPQWASVTVAILALPSPDH